jgi:hypothetical protein
MVVRPYAHTRDYWQVSFDTNCMIVAVLGKGWIPCAPNPGGDAGSFGQLSARLLSLRLAEPLDP